MKTIIDPYHLHSGAAASAGWLKGNLHTHTTASDGVRPIAAVVADYRARGYDFLMISDHDTLTDERQYAGVDNRPLVLIPGNEITARGPHLLHVNADRVVTPEPQRQRVLNAVRAGRGFAIVNHPNWLADFNHCSISRLLEWDGYAGLEIYNGTINRLQGSPYATDKWDMVLSTGRQVWGYAHDDSHLADADVGLGWNVVYAERTVQSIVDALHSGRFYASTGVEITDVAVKGMTITLSTTNAQRIVASMQGGARFAQADGCALAVDVPDDAQYVRFECWGAAEAFAWTQPFFVQAVNE